MKRWKQSRIRLFERVYSIEKREREYSTYRNTVECIVLMLVTIDPILQARKCLIWIQTESLTTLLFYGYLQRIIRNG